MFRFSSRSPNGSNVKLESFPSFGAHEAFETLHRQHGDSLYEESQALVVFQKKFGVILFKEDQPALPQDTEQKNGGDSVGKLKDRKMYWMDDNYCQACYKCGVTFSVVNRKHHCRICGQIFCNNCSLDQIKGKLFGYANKAVRCCESCNMESHNFLAGIRGASRSRGAPGYAVSRAIAAVVRSALESADGKADESGGSPPETPTHFPDDALSETSPSADTEVSGSAKQPGSSLGHQFDASNDGAFTPIAADTAMQAAVDARTPRFYKQNESVDKITPTTRARPRSFVRSSAVGSASTFSKHTGYQDNLLGMQSLLRRKSSIPVAMESIAGEGRSGRGKNIGDDKSDKKLNMLIDATDDHDERGVTAKDRFFEEELELTPSDDDGGDSSAQDIARKPSSSNANKTNIMEGTASATGSNSASSPTNGTDSNPHSSGTYVNRSLKRLSQPEHIEGRSPLFVQNGAVNITDFGSRLDRDNDILICGWMLKEGQVNRLYRTRFFVLHRTALFYYKRQATFQENQRPQGKIDLDEVHMVSHASDIKTLANHPFAIELRGTKRQWILVPASASAMNQWLVALRRCLDRHPPDEVEEDNGQMYFSSEGSPSSDEEVEGFIPAPKAKGPVEHLLARATSQKDISTSPPRTRENMEVVEDPETTTKELEILIANAASRLRIFLTKAFTEAPETANQAEEWITAAERLVHKAIDTVVPKNEEGDWLSILPYVKIKSIRGGKVSDSAYVDGLVFRKMPAHRAMSSLVPSPRILLLGNGLVFQRQSLTSFETLGSQEDHYMELQVQKLADLRPTVIIVGGPVSRKAVEMLVEKRITLLHNVKPSLLDEAARLLGAVVVPSVAQLDTLSAEEIIGKCETFEVVKANQPNVSTDGNARKKAPFYAFLRGCPAHSGCSLLLRGSSDENILKTAKSIISRALHYAYDWKLSSYLAHDMCLREDHPIRNTLYPGLILFSETCLKNQKQDPPATLKSVKCYDVRDQSLLKYLTYATSRISSRRGPNVNEQVYYFRGTGRILVTISDVPITAQPPRAGASAPGKDRNIYTWGYCLKCNRVVTPCVRMSQEALRISFGSYLHKMFTPDIFSCRAENCEHDGVRSSKRFFAKGKGVVCIEYRRIRIYDAMLPSKPPANPHAAKMYQEILCKTLDQQAAKMFDQFLTFCNQKIERCQAGTTPFETDDNEPIAWDGIKSALAKTLVEVNEAKAESQRELQKILNDESYEVFPLFALKKHIYSLAVGWNNQFEILFRKMQLRDANRAIELQSAEAKEENDKSTPAVPGTDSVTVVEREPPSAASVLDGLKDKEKSIYSTRGIINAVQKMVSNNIDAAQKGLSNLDEGYQVHVVPALILRNHNLPPGENGMIVLVDEDMPSTVIAYSLSSAHHERAMRDLIVKVLSSESDPESMGADAQMQRVLLKEFEEEQEKDIVHRFQSEECKFEVVALFASQFYALRALYLGENGERLFIQSLGQSRPWSTSGGKSSADFNKSLDDKFVIKCVSSEEFNMFASICIAYFPFMDMTVSQDYPSALVKILGMYRVKVRRGTSIDVKYVVVMQNLFCGMDISSLRLFDLKGKVRYFGKRARKGAVLLDGDLLRMTKGLPLAMDRISKDILGQSLQNDTLFLQTGSIIDYSLVIGIDTVKRHIVMGVIDYMHSYDWKKRTEYALKTVVTEATIKPPGVYSDRFMAGIEKYFCPVPAAPAAEKQRSRRRTRRESMSLSVFE